MLKKPRIAIVGPGSLGSALAVLLHGAGFRIVELIAKDAPAALRRARKLALRVGARVTPLGQPLITADLVWLCVPDRQIQACGRCLAAKANWEHKIVFHSSGALASDELAVLRKQGAAVASVHPLMTFVPRSVPLLSHVPFAIEGDAKAVQLAKKIIHRLGGESFTIAKRNKAAYHAWGAFASPLMVAELVAAEVVAQSAGVPRERARRMMLPIVRQTIENYARLGPAASFSGPIVRGDAATLTKHLQTLRKTRGPTDVYLALARLALKTLPATNRKMLQRALR